MVRKGLERSPAIVSQAGRSRVDSRTPPDLRLQVPALGLMAVALVTSLWWRRALAAAGALGASFALPTLPFAWRARAGGRDLVFAAPPVLFVRAAAQATGIAIGLTAM